MGLQAEKLVERALDRALELHEIGIQVAAYHRGEPIVDARRGVADPVGDAPVTEDTLFPIFSVSKGPTAVALHIQAERGLVDYDTPVAAYWPAFAAHGKGAVTVRHLLSHRAGVPQLPVGVTPERLGDWEWMVSAIADLAPAFPTDSQNAYHALGWGWIVGEIVRRSDPEHRSFDRFISEEITEPLGIRDLHYGLDGEDLGRVATLFGGAGGFKMAGAAADLTDPLNAMPEAVKLCADIHNRAVVRRAVYPAAGCLCTAASLARFYAMLAEGGALDGVRILSEERIETFFAPRRDPRQPDAVLGGVGWMGGMGFWLGGESPPAHPLVGTGTRIITNPGAGGNIGWADRDERLAVAFTHNNMDAAASAASEGSEHPFRPAIDAIRTIASAR